MCSDALDSGSDRTNGPTEQRTASILIGGDLAPTGDLEKLLSQGGYAHVFGDLLDDFASADLVIANLECPLVGSASSIEKVGPSLRAGVGCIRGLRAAGFEVLSLANNHIMDYGPQGLNSTLDACLNGGIDTVGAGADLQEANRILVRTCNGIRIGIYSMAEHEFSIASTSRPGANPLSPISFIRTVKRARDSVDFLLVLLHAGAEHCQYPSPWLQELARFFTEEGADAVICQHSHCPGSYEEHNGKLIVYGQGNLLFGMGASFPLWDWGFLVHLNISSGPSCTTQESFIPYHFNRTQNKLENLQGKERAGFIGDLTARSKVLEVPDCLENLWKQFCYGNRHKILSSLLSFNRYSRFFLTKTRLAEVLLSRQSKLVLMGTLRCESHRQAALCALETLLQGK